MTFICFCFEKNLYKTHSCNEDTVTIVDVTNKNAPVQLSRTAYEMTLFNVYTHQGWLTEDHNHFMYVATVNGGEIVFCALPRTMFFPEPPQQFIYWGTDLETSMTNGGRGSTPGHWY
jgi:hypothetical protein